MRAVAACIDGCVVFQKGFRKLWKIVAQIVCFAVVGRASTPEIEASAAHSAQCA